MAANAAATPLSSARCDGACALISTSVPSQSWARRFASDDSGARKGLLVKLKQAVHAFRDVSARQGRAGNIADVGVELDGIGSALAGELRAPCSELDRVAMRFPVGEHVDRFDRARRIERQAVGDQFHLADDFVDDEPAERAVAGTYAPDLRRDDKTSSIARDLRLDVGAHDER